MVTVLSQDYRWKRLGWWSWHPSRPVDIRCLVMYASMEKLHDTMYEMLQHSDTSLYQATGHLL